MVNNDNAIEVKNVKKVFKVYHDKGNTLKERALHWSRNVYEEREVLKGISFDVRKGEAIGLIGHNGCGKSTTLKMLTKIMYPDSGTIEMNGRVSSLLELGAGFHPDLSGRENIYINASIFGLSKSEINKRIENIIEFSELEEFIDNPVRTYSSGMYMRLAFSVAINVNADILLIDEILAVGDVNFQAKCFNKLMEIKAAGTTIVLVSHSTGQIEQLCERSIWIHDGLIKMDGNAKDVHKEYLLFMGDQRREHAVRENEKKEEKQSNVSETVSENREEIVKNDTELPLDRKLVCTSEEKYEVHRMGTGEARIEKVICYNKKDKENTIFKTGETIKFGLKYRVNTPIKKAIFGLSIFRVDGLRCYGTNSLVDDIEPFLIEKDGEVFLEFNNAQLLPGKYYVDVCIMYGVCDSVDYFDKAAFFEIFSTTEDVGVIRMDHQWKL